MMKIFYPKNTLLSVASDLREGLENKTIYLNDQELDEAGYEVRPIVPHTPFIFFKFLHLIIIIISIFFLGLAYKNTLNGYFYHIISLISIVWVSIINLAITRYLYEKYKGHHGRHITRKSSRRE